MASALPLLVSDELLLATVVVLLVSGDIREMIDIRFGMMLR